MKQKRNASELSEREMLQKPLTHKHNQMPAAHYNLFSRRDENDWSSNRASEWGRRGVWTWHVSFWVFTVTSNLWFPCIIQSLRLRWSFLFLLYSVFQYRMVWLKMWNLWTIFIYKMINSTLFGIGIINFPNLMGSKKKDISKVIADAFPSWHWASPLFATKYNNWTAN